MSCDQDTPLEIIKGADFNITVELTDEDDVAIDLTNFTAYMEIRERDNHTSTLWITPTVTIEDPTTDGIISISISSTETESITWSKGFYDLFIISNTDVRTRVLKGIVTVDNSVSF
jgi:hypothetical protein